MKDFILPLVALIGGIASLFIDSKDAAKRWIFIAGLAITAIVTIVFNIQDNQTKQAERSEAVNAERKRADDLKTALDALIAKVDDTPAKVFRLISQGFLREKAESATPQEVASAFRADRKYNSLVSAGANFPGLVVEYYPKGLDSAEVKRAIETLGFKVTIAQPKNDTPTNALWVGPKVSDEAWHFVAYALLRAGAKISSVSRIPNPAGARASIIQIGSDPAFADRPGMTLEAIEALRNSSLK